MDTTMTTDATNRAKLRFADGVTGAGAADEQPRLKAYWKMIDKYRRLAEELHRGLITGAGPGTRGRERKTRKG